MASTLKPHHHYKGDDLTPNEKVERKVVEILLQTDLPDSKRESSIVWELKHSSGCCQIARILAQKRGLQMEIAEIAALLHDINVIVNGTYKNHGPLGAPIARKILEEVGGFSEHDIETITDAIAHHSEKDQISDNPYAELVKDADVFECSLYKGAEGDYRANKPVALVEANERRIQKVRREFGLDPDRIWRP